MSSFKIKASSNMVNVNPQPEVVPTFSFEKYKDGSNKPKMNYSNIVPTTVNKPSNGSSSGIYMKQTPTAYQDYL